MINLDRNFDIKIDYDFDAKQKLFSSQGHAIDFLGINLIITCV